ncbi:MAG: hypothetical protein OJF49_001514 [Ktedonobacterales bacterium]|nr:MAG: hypothetical protein OJF49_001514 [Ktedonobacterales bacterium]
MHTPVGNMNEGRRVAQHIVAENGEDGIAYATFICGDTQDIGSEGVDGGGGAVRPALIASWQRREGYTAPKGYGAPFVGSEKRR